MPELSRTKWPIWPRWQILLAFSTMLTAAQAGDGLSVMEVIQRTQALDGQNISVIGHVTFQFEGNAIYESEEDLKAHALNRAIALDIYRPSGAWTKSDSVKWRQLHDRYEQLYAGKKVVIKGEYRSGPGGHLGVIPGGELLVEQIDLQK